jgi:Tol biopolymer transport system component
MEGMEMEGMMRRPVLGIAATMVAAMLAACGGAMLAVKEPAQAAYPGQNGRIAYVSHLPSGLHEIYTMNPNGTDRKQLTDDSVYDTSPVYSPSGTKIAFVGQDEDEDILVMNAKDGSAKKELTNTPPVNGYEVRERGPAYSPDGTKIVFYKETFRPHDVDLYTINANGTRVKQITDYKGKEYSPDWSPSGHRIVFHQYTPTKGLRIFTIRPDGTDRQLVIQDGKDPVWSPDGRKIAFTRDGNAYTVNPDGSGVTEVPGTPKENGLSESLPSWGPRSASTQQ